MDERGLGDRIAEAREAAGMNQSQLAREMGMEPSAVNRIERGGRRVTAFELSEIARVLDRQMEWFLTEPTAAIISHREREGTSRRTIDASLERLTREIQFVTSVGGRLALRSFEPRQVPTSTAEAEALAREIRSELGNPAEPLVDLVAASEQLGLLAFSQALGTDAADGGSVLLDQGGVALVNSAADVGRRRMTLAHEIGHYVVADEYTIDLSVLLSGSGDRESLLDRLARALLCPAGPTQAYWGRQLEVHDVRSAALRSASYWRVDFATLARRLLDLRLVDAGRAREIRSIKAVKADYIELDLHVPDDLAGDALAPSFERAVLALYRAETISSTRALQLLQGVYEEIDLPERSIKPESAAWQIVW